MLKRIIIKGVTVKIKRILQILTILIMIAGAIFPVLNQNMNVTVGAASINKKT